MRFFKDIYYGVASHVEASVFIIKHNLWLYFLIPALLMVGIYAGGEFLFEKLIKTFAFEKITALDFSELQTSEDVFDMLLLGIELISVFVIARFGNYIVLIVLSPVLTLLSAKTETLITQMSIPFTLKLFYDDLVRAIQISLRNMFVHMVIVALWYILSLLLLPFEDKIPLGFINNAVTFVIGFYFYGFSLVDYSSERMRLNMDESIKFVRKHAGIAIIVGGVFSGLFLIPYAGVVIAPILGIVSATLAVSKVVDLSKNPFAVPVKMKKQQTNG